MTWEEEKESLKARVEKASADLGEHFDSVRVFCTKQTEDGDGNTLQVDSGCGNFYAQLGQVHEWLTIQTQYQKNWAIKKDGEEI